ncbi:outer membrane protein [Tropicimonas sp. IMCC34043]|uniref:outer membrane protein n=1 Tax=Tropicimonas sp. IMCC34043 TaxID=2248760 RepID=UPI000E28938A|nr:outer membrane beta-barrel protein [Tropicimonas sp. IMCC34043]
MPRFFPALIACTALALPAAAADLELSFYTGYQGAADSRVKGNDGDQDFNFTADWDGKSWAMPPYYGLRAMWWQDRVGYGVEFNHAKVYATDSTKSDNDFDTLEMTDGLNLITFNVFYRWNGLWGGGKLTPYVGGGAGFAMPHVEVTRGDSTTSEYQITGPAVIAVAGLSWAFAEKWAVFGEYKGSYSSNTADLDNGGELKTDIVTNAFNVGLSYTF